MRLKKVEIQGFKSFADKTEINIKDGITAIVGPNGSGKSNISDAIRWVLGEQSVKNLRGSKMEDVIFAGTSKRKALGYAEVTITFDNKSGLIPVDYSEVAVTRRMFRSGESEYYINKNSCRLKDIRELFMDTGIGKDGYSIIGQGRIEEILSNRPEDRRSIFEEAAGIVKYKSKKEEAERKLEKTEGNIIRIKDLVSELSSQLQNLEAQSHKANCFTKLYNRLKELEINLFIRDIRKIDLQIGEINKEKLTLEEEINKNSLERQTIEDEFNILKDKIETLEEKIESLRGVNLSNSSELDKNKNELSLIQEKEKFYNKDLERIKDEKDKLVNRLKAIEEMNLELVKEKSITQEEYNKLNNIYIEKTLELEKDIKFILDKEKEIEVEKNNVIRIYNNTSDKKSELNSISSFNDNIEKRIFQLEKEINEMKTEEKLILENKLEITQSEGNFKEELSTLLEELNNIQVIEKENNEIFDSVNKKININNSDLHSKKSSLKLFKNMEEDYEGYYKGVKSLLIASKDDSRLKEGLVGVVGELVKVGQKFERAIDISLGSNVQNMVTETEEHGKKAIEYLKKNKLGRITCLPLNVISGNVIDISTQDREKFKILGLGFELIDYDKRYEELFKYLLGRTIIVEDMDYGIKLANKYKHKYKIVTLQGEVLNPGGSMTGGSYASNSVSIINRKSRIEALEMEIEDLNLEKEELEKQSTSLSINIKDVQNKIFKITEKIKDTEYSIINAENLREKHTSEANKISELIKKAEKEITSLSLEINDFNTKRQELSNLVKSLEEESLEQKGKIQLLSTSLNEEKSIREDKAKFATDMKINLHNIENVLRNLNEKIEENKQEIQNISISFDEKDKEIQSNIVKIEEISKVKYSINNKIEELNIVVAKTKEELEELIKDKDKLMKGFYSEQDRLRDINKIINETERTINSQDVKLARISVQYENYHKKLSEDYELSYEEALNHEIEIKNIQDELVETRRLKGEIKELGSVNLGSIEEYKVLNERLDFILKQQNDLLNAKENLNEVIIDMESKMKDQFVISFRMINENFKEIFKILFDGGQAELVLNDVDDILNSGIDINAQPPGKKLQNLSLLSGGEKSLTAVALLFSILKLKPSPFCILDEIDAALDEANISRYTNYLKMFYQDTQFVLITHRKTTMEIADILYGVAMEQDGISKLISVKLKDNKNEIAS
ncbi:chromosome segregation protein SMC [Tissierella sp.]|uniref:chromosome segregation protein SMC n=1 Tax=Tissierella sp. TaxID=41274 RepID=UPI002862BDD9|nr:chromosome segregation protein SMC [Tissierella sp.]MDR7856363.1 chromosome segregation protein SMC [Tissierella sp.]